MTSLPHHPAYLQIEDRLDAMGQKYRGQRIIRGAILWLTTAIGASAAASLAAHWIGSASTGASAWTYLVLALWLAVLAGGAIAWVLRPLLIRPTAVEIARLLEGRVGGLHNGLTNSVLLAQADDLEASPWLPQIFQEVQATLSEQPISSAVRLADLRSLIARCAFITLPLLVLFPMLPGPFVHGWQQMFHPRAFVPRVAEMKILSVQPGDVTLVAGQPLEISATASGPQTPDARLIFDNDAPAAALSPASIEGGLRYAYRMEHVDRSLRYRFDVGGSQSRWYSAQVVRQIKLQELALKITPPPYTGRSASSLLLKPEQLEGVPITVAQGGTVELSARIDVPVNGAMLQLGDRAPAAMSSTLDRTRFSATFTIDGDLPVALLLGDGAGQIIAKLPEQPLVIRCTKDAGPTVEMRWPRQDVAIAPQAEAKVQATLKDDFGIASARMLMSTAADAPLTPFRTMNYPQGTATAELSSLLELKPEVRKHGRSIRVQVEVTDNRQIPGVDGSGGRQTTVSPIFEIKFRDAEVIAREQQEAAEKLRLILKQMLKQQQALHGQAVAYKPGAAELAGKVNDGQSKLRELMQSTADTFAFDESNRIVQKTLAVLALNPAKDAVDRSAALALASDAKDQVRLCEELRASQRRIISTLEGLLALLNATPEPTTRPTTRENDPLLSKPDAFRKLDEALKQYMADQQKILDQTAGLAKKPVDNYSDADKALLNELLQQQDKLDSFMKATVSDFSKLAEQDMSNASLLKDAMAIYSEVTMAKDALAQKAVEIAVPAEEGGIEAARELASNIEKWLADAPDRQKWTQEELPEKSDTPMPELPTELEDMVGELMEQQEDLFEEIEDMNANIADSPDKGIGWDAMDGPIASMSAKGVTGNVLPNNNDMGGRSGEGRSGRSQGEFVGDNAIGKGGRNTPTRLDPTPFAQGQINDTSKDPVGGATGGGKLSGQGAAGLQGPVPPKIQEGLMRLASKQAEIRNSAERLALRYKLDRYDNFRMAESILMMRRVESDLLSNRYQTAMRRRDVLLDDLDTSHLMLSGRIHVEHDTTPTTSLKTQQELNDAMKGELPPAWSEALKEYYKKLAAE